jgi:hypothetical protein
MRLRSFSLALLYVSNLAAVLASLYCVLWVVSSSSLACTECNCEYSLFAANARCRQPLLAMVLAALALLFAVVTFTLANKLRKRLPNEA